MPRKTSVPTGGKASKPSKPSREKIGANAASAKKMSRNTERSEATRKRILDAAEELFSEHGLHGVSIRDIGELAKVETPLLYYYFDTKNGVFDAVLLRRAGRVNELRLAALDSYTAKVASGAQVSVEGILAAYLEPIFRIVQSGGRGWRNYAALIALVNNSSGWGSEPVKQHFDPIVRRMIELLKQALPQAHERDIYWGYHFLSGALTLTYSRNKRIDMLSKNMCRASDFAAIEPRLVAYCAAGLRAICKRE